MAIRKRVAPGLFFLFLCIPTGAAPGGVVPGDTVPYDCEPKMDLVALSEYLKPNAAVLIGEMHGTKESPEFVRDVACSALSAKHRVTVALEIPEDRALENSLYIQDSNGSFWKSSYQDGRRSIAMRDLIEQLRAWRRKGNQVRLLTIDAAPASRGAARDEAMAKRLAEDIQSNGDNVYVVLTGNIHNRLDRGTPWDKNYVPMGMALASIVKDNNMNTLIVSLAPHYYGGGNAHICVSKDDSSCGEVSLSKRPRTEALDRAGRGIRITTSSAKSASASLQGYYYFRDPVSASGPAVTSSRVKPLGPP